MAKRKFDISFILIVVGAVCIAAALVLEAIHFPWRGYVGIIPDADDMPDPPPLVLEGEDKDIPVYYESMPPGQTVKPGTKPTTGSLPSDTNGEEPPFETDPPETDPPSSDLPGNKVDYSPPKSFITLGIIKIPKLGISSYVLEGAGRQMIYGGGHVVGTAGLGEEGNCVIAGHRAYGFRYLTLLKPGDKVVLKEKDTNYTYIVYETFEVEPDELWVLSPVEGESHILSLVTCTPLVTYTHRLIIRARLEGTP